jgi:hypothetical protein
MIPQQEFNALVALYDQHGWLLRRVALQDVRNAWGGLGKDIKITSGSVDAVWFSRPPQRGSVAWEIRYLGSPQYALVAHLDENSHDFEDRLYQTEQRLADAVAKKQAA